MALVIPHDLRRFLRFGAGVGIAVGPQDLEVLIARVRPSSLRVGGYLRVAGFEQRSAAEWGGEVTRFLALHGAARVAAVVTLPREAMVVRTVALPGVRDEDAGRALEFQLENLHPWLDDEVAWAWQRIGSSVHFSVAIVQRAVLDRYAALFAEAGVKIARFTFSAAAMVSSTVLRPITGASRFGWMASRWIRMRAGVKGIRWAYLSCS